ncbi:dynein axonemal heavy chain 1-like [Trachinotus anak]|uniref:dynein axonemal heavy chain 1-like n=1 Tax=Trachinotus anak TaxID=443729 RepID=UPI0039F1AD12
MMKKNAHGFGAHVPHPPSKPPEPKPSNLSHRRRRLPLLRESSLNVQEGLYSEIIAPSRFQFPKVGPEIEQKSLGQSSFQSSDYNTPKVTAVKTPPNQCMFPEKNYQGPISHVSQNPYFCRNGDKPKVRIPYQTTPGQIPRKLAIERCRREYLILDFEQLLAEKGIDSNLIMPRRPNSSDEDVTTPDNPVSPYLALEIFDNEDYDCRTPEDWLALGSTEGSPHQKPVPGKALLPAEETKSSCLEYSWHLVGVLDYSEEKRQYLVQKVHQNSKVTEEEGNPTRNEGHKKSQFPGVKLLLPGTKYWVPRIRLLFFAEDPRVFVERIQFALHSRENTEALIFYHLAVDCMPISRTTPSLDTDSLQRMKKYALSTPGLRQNIIDKCIGDLEKQVKLDYQCAMNHMDFDKTVMRNPKQFSHITLPKKDAEHVPQKGCIPVPHYDYKNNQAAFFVHSLLTKPEVTCVLPEIWAECNKVATMKLFNVTSNKLLQLDEFEMIQNQMHTQISLFLRESWRVTLCYSIRSNLGNIGKGTYNVNESLWDMYKMSKLYRLMTMVHFKMQDSLRYLVQNSLVSLTNLLLDACHSVLTCPQDLVWGNNLITSPYK